MRPLEELINTDEPGWDLIQDWLKEATNQVEVLPCLREAGERGLFESQVTSRSPMGAIALETGGILIDHGWLRMFGAGSERLPRSMSSWNLGRSLKQYGEAAPFWIVADDVVGGTFAINGGGLGETPGSVYYFAPDTLAWEPLDMGYSEYVWWCFTGDLATFYDGFRWVGWQAEVANLPGHMVVGFYPFLFAEAQSIESRSRKMVSADETYRLLIG